MLVVSCRIGESSLARLVIWNESDLSPISDYGYQAAWTEMDDPTHYLAHGSIHGHERAQPVWSLVAKVLDDMGFGPTTARGAFARSHDTEQGLGRSARDDGGR